MLEIFTICVSLKLFLSVRFSNIYTCLYLSHIAHVLVTIDYFSDEITDCINNSPGQNKTLTFLKLFELSVMRIKLKYKAVLGLHRVWKFEKGRNIEFYLFSGKLSPFSNFFNKGFEIKLAIIGTTVLVVRRSKTLNKKVPNSKSWPNHFKETVVSWSI